MTTSPTVDELDAAWHTPPSAETAAATATAASSSDAGSTFAEDVAVEAHRQRVRTAAAELLAREQAQAITLPDPVRLDRFLEQPDPPLAYRVDQLLTVGGRVLFTAAAKSGKSTARDELLRSLVDGVPFLGRFDVQRAERVVLVDNELHEHTLRRWLRDHRIESTDRVDVVPLRGRVGTFDITTDAGRSRWAQHIGPADVMLFDCLRPVLDSLGMDESREAGRFLVAFDALLHEAGIGEAVLVHHMGHSTERSRGDSRLRDWPDAEWRIVREKGDDPNEINPNARRYFSAYGRDVNQPEGLLSFDNETRALTLAGGTRADTAGDEAMPSVLALVNEHPEGLTGRAIEDALAEGDHTQAQVRAARKRAVSRGLLKIIPGPRRAQIHHLTAEGAAQCG